MAFLLKKMIKSWESSRDPHDLKGSAEHPTEPPAPDLSHLNQDEISAISDVIRRQEMFERAEADRVRKIQDELEGLQMQLVARSTGGPQNPKTVDLRLCRLCFRNKFADGVGRLCHDCHQRVCAQCGAFSKPRWNSRKNKTVRGRWRCKLCTARREALCRTGGWYHGVGESPESAVGLRKKLSSNWELDTDAGSSTYQGNGTTNVEEDSEAYPSGNRSDSELIHSKSSLINCSNNRRRSSVKQHSAAVAAVSRRFSLSNETTTSISLDRGGGGTGNGNRHAAHAHDTDGTGRWGGGEVDEEEDDDDDQDSFDSLVLERKLSRRRRQEKRQRRKFRNGNDKVPEEQNSGYHVVSNGGSFHDTDHVMSNGGSFHDTEPEEPDPGVKVTTKPSVPVERVQDRNPSIGRLKSAMGHSQSMNLVPGHESPHLRPKNPQHLKDSKNSLCCDSSVTESSSMISYVDSSMSDAGTPSPVPLPSSALRIIRQDAISLGSSCVSIASTGDGSSRRGDSVYSLLEPSERGKMGKDVNGTQVGGVSKEPRGSTTKPEDAISSILEEVAAKWMNLGYKDSYALSAQPQTKEPVYGLQIMGGIVDAKSCALSILTWASSSIKASLTVGNEILEWNNESLRGKTYDQVVMATSAIHPHVTIVLNPVHRTETGELLGEKSVPESHPSRSASTDGQGRPTKRRMLPRTPVEIKRAVRQVRGELQIKLNYSVSSGSLSVTIAGSRRLGMPDQDSHIAPSPFVIVHMVPSRCDRECIDTELKASDERPELAQTFVFDNFSITEVMSKSVAFCVWNCDNRGELFLGEVLVDLVDTDLTDQPVWYQLQDHDENSSPLPTRGHRRSTSMSGSLTSGSFNFISPAISPEVPSYRHQHSSPSIGANASPVPSFSRVGSREFHLNSASQPDTFTTKVRKKMRNTVNKMSSLSLSDKRDYSDDSAVNESIQRYSSKSDRPPNTRSPSVLKKRQNSKDQSREHSSMDLLALPKSLSRSNSTSSFFMSEDEESRRGLSVSSVNSDRPPPEGDDITSILGPGQIPPKPSAETSVCGDIKLGFMVSKGQLEVDIICAAGLLKAGVQQAPDTYVKTYLVEGKKVIQRKKTLIVKASFDPVYRKKIKYSACNVHGRIMKIDVWEKVGSFEKKVCRGEVLVKLDGLDLSTHTMAWYKLFPMNATDYGSDEFLSSW